MRRYTAIKSNVYAPTSTNVIQQNMLHCHMTCHYRMMYNAKSKVDSSPPRHYKGRFTMADCSRKKLNKHPVRTNRTKAAHRAEVDLQNQLLIDRILFDTKLPPSAYVDECVTQRQYMLNEPKINKLRHAENDRINSKDVCQYQNINVPSLNISTAKVRQVPQFRDFLSQTWTKKVASGNKRNSSLVKHLESPQDVVRNNIPRQMSKPRLYHTSQPRRALFQGDTACVSSGSEGNAGDDEDGAPTSSYDDSNPSDNEKQKLVGRKVTTPDSNSLLKKSTKKRLGNACICIPAIEEVKKFPASEVSSRDSAYEGGEGMSSTEKERISPDRADDSICHCVDVHYSCGSKADDMSCSVPKEETQFCFKSELYMKFLQDVTDDILVKGVYSNDALERLFQEHICNNVYNLDENHLWVMIKKLGEDLGMAVNHYKEDKLFDKGATNSSTLSVEKGRNTENIWPQVSPENYSLKVNDVGGNQFNCKPEKGNEVNLVHIPWTKKHFPSGETKTSSSVVIIEQNFSMSKKDILGNLAELGFDESMAEEIYHILAGKGGTYPDFTLKELQDIIKQ
ncbi:spermatogenesis-associated protein 7 homolog [Hetaerina americana]|uniref:spermatogenesis-associated protein 7 homolog n=1 Tax=Hetaerina americana TaxID=62018 RepID=UPI003A7F310D